MTKEMRKAANAYKTARQNTMAVNALKIMKRKRPIEEVMRDILDTVTKATIYTP